MKAETTTAETVRVEAKIAIRPRLAISPEMSCNNSAVASYQADFIKSVQNALPASYDHQVLQNPTICQDHDELFIVAKVVMEPDAGSELGLAWQHYKYEFEKNTKDVDEAAAALKKTILERIPDNGHGLKSSSFRLNIVLAAHEVL